MNSSVLYEEDVIKMKLKSTKDIFRIPKENFNLKDKTRGVRGEVLDLLLLIFTKGGREVPYIRCIVWLWCTWFYKYQDSLELSTWYFLDLKHVKIPLFDVKAVRFNLTNVKCWYWKFTRRKNIWKVVLETMGFFLHEFWFYYFLEGN